MIEVQLHEKMRRSFGSSAERYARPKCCRQQCSGCCSPFRFNGRLSYCAEGQVLKSGYEEGYFGNRKRGKRPATVTASFIK